MIETTLSDNNGDYEVTIDGTDLDVGTNILYAKTTTDSGEVTTETITITVISHSYALSIQANKQTMYMDETITFDGVLTRDNVAFAGQTVQLYDGSTVIATLTTGSDGGYTATVSNLSVGTHSFKAVNSNAESSTVSVLVNEHTYSLAVDIPASVGIDEPFRVGALLKKDNVGWTGQTVYLYCDNVNVGTLVESSMTQGGYTNLETCEDLGVSVGNHNFKVVNSEIESETYVVEVTAQHDYALSVASTKDILSYADSESATVTGTLTDNGVAVAGETLSYSVKKGSTVISSGSGTTNSNGEVSITYASTGIGDVTIEFDYGVLLQETYELEDCREYYTTSTNFPRYSWGSNWYYLSSNEVPTQCKVHMKFANDVNNYQVGLGSSSGNFFVIQPYSSSQIDVYRNDGTTRETVTPPSTSTDICFEIDSATGKLYFDDTLIGTYTLNSSINRYLKIVDYQGKAYDLTYIKVKAL